MEGQVCRLPELRRIAEATDASPCSTMRTFRVLVVRVAEQWTTSA